MKKKKNILVLLILFLSIGVTIAYLQSTDTFENIFNAGTYKTVTTEEFTSPTNWAPGDTTEKTITTTNQGTIPVRVRVKLTETWTSSNDGNLPLESNGIQLAIINLDNTEDWVKDGDYYYYVGELAPGETTSSLIESVTFNPDYEGDISCTTVDNTKTCESSSDGYMGGTYTLNITTETVQSDAFQEVWELEYNPTEERYSYTSTTNGIIYDDISGHTTEEDYQSTNKNIFLRYKVLGQTIKDSSVGFILNGNAYYLKGAGATYNQEGGYYNSDSIYYEENKTTLLNAFGSENCTDYTTYMTCQAASVYAEARGYGSVYANDGDWECYVHYDGSSECYAT